LFCEDTKQGGVLPCVWCPHRTKTEPSESSMIFQFIKKPNILVDVRFFLWLQKSIFWLNPLLFTKNGLRIGSFL
jgi:hypothetical protein